MLTKIVTLLVLMVNFIFSKIDTPEIYSKKIKNSSLIKKNEVRNFEGEISLLSQGISVISAENVERIKLSDVEESKAVPVAEVETNIDESNIIKYQEINFTLAKILIEKAKEAYKTNQFIKAFTFYKQAALYNYPPAIRDLGICYVDGIGTIPNYQKALLCFLTIKDPNYSFSLLVRLPEFNNICLANNFLDKEIKTHLDFNYNNYKIRLPIPIELINESGKDIIRDAYFMFNIIIDQDWPLEVDFVESKIDIENSFFFLKGILRQTEQFPLEIPLKNLKELHLEFNPNNVIPDSETFVNLLSIIDEIKQLNLSNHQNIAYSGYENNFLFQKAFSMMIQILEKFYKNQTFWFPFTTKDLELSFARNLKALTGLILFINGLKLSEATDFTPPTEGKMAATAIEEPIIKRLATTTLTGDVKENEPVITHDVSIQTDESDSKLRHLEKTEPHIEIFYDILRSRNLYDFFYYKIKGDLSKVPNDCFLTHDLLSSAWKDYKYYINNNIHMLRALK